MGGLIHARIKVIIMMPSNRNFFPHYWPFVWGIHRSPVNSPHKSQWHGAFSDVCFDLSLNKQSGGWWFEEPSRSFWHHCNDWKVPQPPSQHSISIYMMGVHPFVKSTAHEVCTQLMLHCVLLCCGTGQFDPYPSGLRHWRQDSLTISQAPCQEAYIVSLQLTHWWFSARLQ